VDARNRIISSATARRCAMLADVPIAKDDVLGHQLGECGHPQQ
jgi:hypothetical protein